jgi:hypothetical protein
MTPNVALTVSVFGLATVARLAGAQSIDQQSAYRAMIYTPVAGLAPLPPVIDSFARKGSSGITLMGRLGHMSRRGGLSLTTYGAGVEIPRGRMRLGATLAYLSASCGFEWEGDPDCSGDVMLGGTVRGMLLSKPVGEKPAPPVKGRKAPPPPKNESKFVVGFDGSAGYSPKQGESALAFSAGLPSGIVLHNGSMRITPFITPGLGYGRLGSVAEFEDEPATAHGTIVPMIGGGVGVDFSTTGVGVNVGFQRVLKGAGGATQLGIGVTWQGMTASR